MADEEKRLLDNAPPGMMNYPATPQSFPPVQIVQQQPNYGHVNRPPQPPDHVGMAMFSLVCCFWPVGIIALIFAFRSRYRYIDGDYTSAEQYSKKARKMAIIAIVLGIVLIIGLVLLYAATGAIAPIIEATSNNDPEDN